MSKRKCIWAVGVLGARVLTIYVRCCVSFACCVICMDACCATPLHFFFLFDRRHPQLKLTHPQLTFEQLGRTMGGEWRAMSQQERLPYIMHCEEDKRRYSSEAALINTSVSGQEYNKVGRGGGKKRKKKKRRYNEALPKRSQSAYLYFAQVTALVTLFQIDSLHRVVTDTARWAPFLYCFTTAASSTDTG